MPSRLVIALVAIVFLTTVIMRLPASLLTSLLPKDVACIEPSGTLWHGACGQLHAGSMSIAGLRWTLHAPALLRAQAQLDLTSDDPQALGRGSVTLARNGDAEITGLSASLPLQPGLTPLPAGWSGQLQLDLPHASLVARHLAALEGTVRVRQLRLDRPALDLGSFELDVPAAAAGAPIAGTLHDLDGPIALQGTVQLAGDAYQLDAQLAPRDAANTNLAQMLQLLGPADAQGRHTLSIAGSY